MLHLFNKIYVARDSRVIDKNYNRIVISKVYGVPINDLVLETHKAELFKYALNLEDLVGEGKEFSSLKDMFSFLLDKTNTTNQPSYIFCDEDTYLKILVTWYKNLLLNASKQDIFAYLNSANVRHYFFDRFARSSINYLDFDFPMEDYTFTQEKFSDIYDNVELDSDLQKFISDNKSSLNIELLLANYLYDGSYQNELSKSIVPLIKKDMEKFLEEIKEVFLVSYMKTNFLSNLGSNKALTLSNMQDVITDETPFVKVFFDKDIWRDYRAREVTSGKNIKFDNLTDEKIKLMTDALDIMCKCPGLEEEMIYNLRNKSDVHKLDFVKYLRNTTALSKEGLDAILNFEKAGGHAAGSFYSIDTLTVNMYFVYHILKLSKDNNLDALRPYKI